MAERFASGADIAQVSGIITGGATLVLTESAEAWQALAVFDGLALDEIAELVNNPESAILDQLKIDDKKAENFLQKPPEADDFRLALWGCEQNMGSTARCHQDSPTPGHHHRATSISWLNDRNSGKPPCSCFLPGITRRQLYATRCWPLG